MEKERQTRRPPHTANVTTRRPPPPSFDPIEIWKQDQEHQKHEHDNARSSPSSKSNNNINNKTENKNNTNNKTDSHNIDEDDDAYYWRSAIERLLQPEEDEKQQPQQPQNGVKSAAATDAIRGITTLVLPRAVAQVVSHSWKVIGHGLEVLHDHPTLVSHVQPTDDTAHCTGYHDCAAAAVEHDNQENNNDDNDKNDNNNNNKKTINGKNNNNTKRGESSLSNRYNEFRRGLVLSDGACTCPRSAAISLSSSSSALSSSSSKATVEQEEQEAFLQTLDQSLVDLFWILHSILEQLLQALSWHWELPFTDLPTTTSTNGPGAGGGRGDHQHGSGCCCWFQNVLGPTRQHSQWHIKEYVVPPTSSHLEKQQQHQQQEPPTSPTTVPTTRTTNNNNTNNNNNCTSDGPQEQQHQQRPREQEWLPAHTDPSLLSVILHDTTNEGTSGASGLQYYYQRQWHNVVTNTTTSLSSSPHVVAVVMVGSILSTLTGGRIPACRHRVMYSPESTHDTDANDQTLSSSLSSLSSSSRHSISHNRRRRRAVTLFGRPAPMAPMQRIPSPRFASSQPHQDEQQEPQRQRQQRPEVFQDWLARVARNYEKSKTKKKKKKKEEKTNKDNNKDNNHVRDGLL